MDTPFQWSVVLTELDHLHQLMTKKGEDGRIEVDGWEAVNTTRWEEVDSVHGFISNTILQLKHHVIVVNPVVQAAVQQQIAELEAYLSGTKFPFEWVVTDSSGRSNVYWGGQSSTTNLRLPAITSRTQYSECSVVGCQLLTTLDLPGLGAYMSSLLDAEGGCKLKALVMCGAGISTSAGIPDYRSAGGIFERMKLEHPELAAAERPPEDLFSLSHFKEDPTNFLTRMKHMYADLDPVKPTPTHNFLRLLADKGALLRVYTQNIDGLERRAGVPPEQIVEVHGTMASVSGVDSKQAYDVEEFKEALRNDTWRELFAGHGEVLKPDVVLYGEALPPRFAELAATDVTECNCLIVLGTSLRVRPFNSLLSRVGPDVPRVLVNREPAGVERTHPSQTDGTLRGGFRFEGTGVYRDVFVRGECDAAAQELAAQLGL